MLKLVRNLRREFSGVFLHFITSNVIIPTTHPASSTPRIAAFQQQRCLFIQLQRLEAGAEVTAHRDALPYGGDRIATVVLEGSSQVRVGRRFAAWGPGGMMGMMGMGLD